MTNADRSPRPDLAGPEPGFLQLFLDPEHRDLFPEVTPHERLRRQRQRDPNARREPPPVAGQVWALRRCAAPVAETRAETRARGDSPRGRCPNSVRVLVQPWGGGTESRVYCCEECKQRAYRLRAKAKRNREQTGSTR